MTTAERREEIVSILKQDGFIKSTDMVAHFDISGETVRRDLDFLQSQNILRRVYGGAVLNKDVKIPQNFPDISLRGDISAIGRAAAGLIMPGDTVFLDNGLTVFQIACYLKSRSDITVVTCSLSVANELIDSEVTLFVLGGLVSRSEGEITGDLAVKCTDFFYCDKVFFSCGGITPEVGVMDFCSGTKPMHSHFHSRANKCILVASSKKFGKTSSIAVCPSSDVDLIISDTNLSQEYQSAFSDMGVEMMLVDPDNDIIMK